MNKPLLILALAGSLSALPALSQETDGDDLISSALGLLTQSNGTALGSDAVEKGVDIAYSDVDVNDWDLTLPDGTTFTGEDGTGQRLKLGYRVVGASRDGTLATYGVGLEHARITDDSGGFETSYTGLYGDGGIGYVTDYGLDMTANLSLGIGAGKARVGNTELTGAPLSLGLGVGFGYSYDGFRAEVTYQRRFVSSGASSRILAQEVTDEFSYDTTEIGGSLAFQF